MKRPAPALPTRSQIESWQWNHLTDAAAILRASASQSKEMFNQHVNNIASSSWQGNAKDAAYAGAVADLEVVERQNQVTDEAAAIAESGAVDVRSAIRDALEAISIAENEGFQVSEDLSLSDTRALEELFVGTRQQTAIELAQDVRWYAEQLQSTDLLVGKRLAEKATELEGIGFPGEEREDLQALDFKSSPEDLDGTPFIPDPKPPPPTDAGQGPHGSQPWYSRADDILFKEVARQAADAAEVQGWTHAAKHLRHYLSNSGDDLRVNPDQIMRDVPRIQHTTDAIVTNEVQQIVAEAVAVGNFDTPVPFQSEWTGQYIYPEDSKDWFYAMGGIQQSVTGSVTVQPPSEPGRNPTVTVDYQTHVFDRYNWDGTKATTFDLPGTDGITISDQRMGALHTAGIAQEYNITGSGSVFHYEGSVPHGAPLSLPNAPDNRDGTRSDPWR